MKIKHRNTVLKQKDNLFRKNTDILDEQSGIFET